ncbi:MAG: glycosyltransferase [Candidatus Omnitrophota bacterium]
MKIAFIVTEFPSLSETFVLNQITGLVDLGHEVAIFAYIRPRDKEVHTDVQTYNLYNRVTYFNMPKNKIMRIMKAFWLFIFNFYKWPVETLKSLNFIRFGKSTWNLTLFYCLMPFLGSSFDIIHCHFGPNGIIGAALKDIGIQGKIVTVFHGRDLSTFIREQGHFTYRNLFKNGDLFLPVSNYWEKKLISLKGNSKNIKVHHMGIDLAKFAFNTRRIFSNETIKILTIGRLVEKKGYKYSIQAIARLCSKYKNIEYIIAGEGPLRAKLEAFAEKLNIQNHIKFLGRLSQTEIIKLYEKVHIFVLASITASDCDQEGIPIVLMEAQAAGLPVVSTHYSGISEVVLNGKSGFLVPEKDQNALSEKLSYLIEHPDEWSDMGKVGRSLIAKYYNIRELNGQLVETFKSIL